MIYFWLVYGSALNKYGELELAPVVAFGPDLDTKVLAVVRGRELLEGVFPRSEQYRGHNIQYCHPVASVEGRIALDLTTWAFRVQ